MMQPYFAFLHRRLDIVEKFPRSISDDLRIIRMNQVISRCPQPFFNTVSEYLFNSRIFVSDPSSRVGNNNDVGRLFRNRFE
ncbi:MAG: hypothetical protein BWX55_00407 [Deltaproteobacteria bacterium ADurb.Bin022]|nr:MAG: hypothetical protein BWX55_00407 [Deltaproteobacteria bacterium ADurb.Bin022]